MSLEHRRTRDLIVVTIFVIVLAFLFWPSGDDDPESDAAPDGAAELESQTPEPADVADEEDQLACEPDDAEDLLDRWVESVNLGDREALEAMFPEDSAESPSVTTFPGMDQSILHSFTVHESGQMSSPGNVVDYLEMRHQEYNERWQIEDVELQRMDRGASADGVELDAATVRLLRLADDLHEHKIYGDIILNCFEQTILLVDLFTDDPGLALPIPVDEFLGAVGPYGTGEMRDLRMIVSTDLREDDGSLFQWDIHRIEANSMSGAYVETVKVQTMNGDEILDYVYDGQQWYLEYRGWRETGDLTGWSVLPLEMMMTRLEPSITANVLRDHVDEIPEEGSVTFTGEFEVRDELRLAASLVPRAEAVDGLIEVDVEDGNLIRTSYRLVDRQLGVHSNVPEIRWLHIHRRDRYETGIFIRPPEFSADQQQFVISPELDSRMELIERLEHDDGLGERYALQWDGEEHEVLVMPSRGQSHENSRGDDWPLTWGRERMLVDGHMVVASGPDYDQFPHAAVWDTGRFRFELRTSPDELNDPDSWGFSAIMEIVEAMLESGQLAND